RDALPAAARVVVGAGVAVVARERVVRVRAAARGITAVRRADVAVVAVRGRPGLAGAARARVAGRTGVAVVARRIVIDVDAAVRGVAAVVGAGIAVVAVDRIAHADVGHAPLVRGAMVGIGAVGVRVAAAGDRVVDASGRGIAAVGRTRVAIVAV